MRDTTPNPYRPIRSYVLRGGRLTSGQQRAFEALWPHFGVDWPVGSSLEPRVLFGNTHPVALEIGFGNGENLIATAARHPKRNYLGIEVHRPGVGHLLLQLQQQRLANVRVIRHDAVEVLGHAIPPSSLAEVYLFFPDPWPKKKHHKRRILQPDFLRLLARVIQPGGLFHTATDWQDYARHMLSVLNSTETLFENTAGAGKFSPRPHDRIATKFERRGQRLGHQVWDLSFRRRPTAVSG